ncbi:MAG: hypothetical protein QNJ22_04670 [Desulfosarcinaceae bacterium]|nr:hypothetical protein [Desulfosarcinaceae bacterium]
MVDAAAAAQPPHNRSGGLRWGWWGRFLALVLLVLLLAGNRWPYAPRSFYAAWDQGHILAFALWTALLIGHIPRLSQRSPLYQLTVALCFALIFGLATETLQALGGNGPPDLLDMGRNLIGALTGWAFFTSGLQACPPHHRRRVRLAVGLLIATSLLPLGRALVDEHQARRAFPVLAAFDGPFESDRWSGSARFDIVRPPFAPETPLLRIDFQTTHYSGVALDHFPGDWRGYEALEFRLYNPDTAPLILVCRINDKDHNLAGYRYDDRFNRQLTLPSGWSRIRLPIAQIAAAPQARTMRIEEILQVGLFTVALQTPRTAYLDRMRLVSGELAKPLQDVSKPPQPGNLVDKAASKF